MTLREARALVKLTPAALDRAAGLYPGATRDIEQRRNQSPSWEIVSKLTKALRVHGLRGLKAEDIFTAPADADADATKEAAS